HEPGDAAAQVGDPPERLRREDRRRRRPDALEARADVAGDLGRRQRTEPEAERHALAELAEARIRQDHLELGLPRENDLQDLLPRRLEVRQEAELLEHRRVQVLRLVDQEGYVAARSRVLEQELVEALEQDELPATLGRDAELEEDVFEDLVEGYGRVQQKDGLGRGRDAIEETTEDRRLPGAGVTDERDESLTGVDAVGESRERFLVAVVQVEEAGIGSDVEGQLPEPVEVGVHAAAA